ncbi:hypothetical protein VSR01_16980 [Actinacidiphila sp. DG2A-62]|uniref:hypothetical protein n=1 Tax=Actinacidiphila sp. DG2A-62 TaxID=3108821 RepID=UPI002DB9816C|nr:hypothetical protein [Actinacidiphila sp. DG2A-62]MEC3995132.1 hypothetical protein [Actinacidiphila sp. DG2A-62]
MATTTEEPRSSADKHPDEEAGRPPICGELVTIPTSLTVTAARYANRTGIDPAEIRDVRCTLQAHPTGDHWAFIVEATETTGVWTRWNATDAPEVVFVLPDCPATDPEQQAICSEFEFHDGGHTWQVDDPWDHTARA